MINSSRLIYVSPDRRGYVSSTKQESRRKTATIDDRGYYVCKKCSNTRKELLNTSS